MEFDDILAGNVKGRNHRDLSSMHSIMIVLFVCFLKDIECDKNILFILYDMFLENLASNLIKDDKMD